MNICPTVGKTISFLGASTSTFHGFSNSLLYNSTLNQNISYYPKPYLDCVNDTWWMKVIHELNMELCVNNSWSGSCVTTGKGVESAACMARATELHNDVSGTEPDIIVLIIGGNDALKGFSVGEYHNVDDIFHKDSGSYVGDCSLFGHAYATMVHKVNTRYPNADIFVCSMLHWKDGMEVYNTMIRKIATEFGVTYVDFYNQSSISPMTAEIYLNTDNVHPTIAGHANMANCMIQTLRAKYL